MENVVDKSKWFFEKFVEEGIVPPTPVRIPAPEQFSVDDPEAIYRAALDTFGPVAQTTKCYEEMSELQKELCKHFFGEDNKDHIAEEIADVFITIGQMMILHDCYDEVADWKEKKLIRLAGKVNEHREKAAKICCYRDPLGNCKLMSQDYGPVKCEHPETCELRGRI